MPVDPVKIPQNVQIEDRVVGPLSLRQIIIMAVGGGFSYMIYSGVQKSVGYVGIPLTIIIWIPALIAAAFALVNINDLSLLRICCLLLERLQKPRVRTWAPREGISITIRTSRFKAEEAPNKVETVQKQNTQKQIADLSSVLDQASPKVQEAAPLVEAAPLAAAVPATLTEIVTPPVESAVVADVPAVPKPPVNPERVQVDTPRTSLQAPQMSDLSVFRDIFPPQTQWQA